MISLTRKENGTLVESDTDNFSSFLVCDISENEVKRLKSFLCGYSLKFCECNYNPQPLPKDLSHYTDENINEKIYYKNSIESKPLEYFASLEPETDKLMGLPRLVNRFNSQATIPRIEDLIRIYLVRNELDELNSKGKVFADIFAKERVASSSLYFNPFYYYSINENKVSLEGLSSNAVTFPIIYSKEVL